MRLFNYSMVLALIFSASIAGAQEDSTSLWTKGGVVGLNFSQVQLSNWNAGGQSSISGTGLLNLFANYKKEDKVTWDNTLNLAYGLINQEDVEKVQKTDDRIELNSKLGYHAVKHWYYGALANVRTQFQPGYEDLDQTILISDFAAPAYATVALGMDWKRFEWIQVLTAPITYKGTFVMDQDLADAGAFGVDPAEFVDSVKVSDGANVRTEIGGLVNIVFKKENLVENVNVSATANFFSNYMENPQNIDVNLEALVAMKVNKYLSVTWAGNLIYDDDILIGIDENDDGENEKFAPRTQFKSVLSVGISAKF